MMHMVKNVLQKTAASSKTRGRLNPASFEQNVKFETYAPPEDIAFLVEHFWTIRTRHMDTKYQSEQLMHRPYVDFFISANYSGIQGTFREKRQYAADPGARIIGVRFRPGAFHALYAGKMSDLRDRVIGLEHVFSDYDSQYIDKILRLEDQEVFDQIIEKLRSIKPIQDTRVELVKTIIDMVEARDDVVSLAQIAVAVGKSERWLQQLFREYVGVGLKWFLLTKRLLAVAHSIRYGASDWAALAYDAGYSSQQHFNTDFKRVTGKTPQQYRQEIA